MNITEFIVLVILLWISASLIFFFAKRIKLLIAIKGLRKTDGVSVKILSVPAFLAPGILKTPAARITVRDKVYSVRIFNGRGSLYAAHIADEKYASVFLKTAGGAKVRFFGRRHVRINNLKSNVYFPRTVIMPKRRDGNDIPVMIFNPAPRELTYVTEKKNSIQIAFTGDTVNGEKIFTLSTFLRFVDRDSRGFFDGMKQRTDE